MKHSLKFIFLLSFFTIFISCSNNDEPEYGVFMQPAYITSTAANGWNQTFEYDEYGRIVSWTQIPNSTNEFVYSAHFDYSDKDIIKVTSEEDFMNGDKRYSQETIQLINGRASESEGTFIYYINGISQMQKTYRLAFEYDNSNHLTVIRHSEVYGRTDIKDNSWENAWTWENYLIWEDGNLKELQDYEGNTSVYQTRNYEYSISATEYPLISPIIINNAHHTPLVLQGIFGSNSVNLLKTITVLDEDGNFYLSLQYNYEFDDTRIIEYTEYTSYNTTLSNSISYSVNWTER